MATYSLTVHPDGDVEQKEVPRRGRQGERDLLRHMQDEVGGFIELVPHRDASISCFVDEEGKLKDRQPNLIATRFFGPAWLMPGDYIAGALLILGGVDRHGNTLGLSEGKARELRTVLSGLTEPGSAWLGGVPTTQAKGRQ